MLILLTVFHTLHIFLVEFNRFPELSRTSDLFPGLSSPGKCHNKILGLCRFSRTCTNPVYSYSACMSQTCHGTEFFFQSSMVMEFNELILYCNKIDQTGSCITCPFLNVIPCNVRWCFLRLFKLIYPVPQTEHKCGLSPVCRHMCNLILR